MSPREIDRERGESVCVRERAREIKKDREREREREMGWHQKVEIPTVK